MKTGRQRANKGPKPAPPGPGSFPRGRMHRLLPKGNYSDRVPVYETAVLEYKEEIPEPAGNGAHHKAYTTHPTPRSLKSSTRNFGVALPSHSAASCSTSLLRPRAVTSGSFQRQSSHYSTVTTITVLTLWCARTRTHTQLPNHSRAANLKKLITFITKLVGKLRDLCPVKLFHLKLVGGSEKSL